MAAGHAMPASVHDADHLHTHARQHITQHLQVDHVTTGGMNGGPSTHEDNKTSRSVQSQSHSHTHLPQNSGQQSHEDNEHLDSTSQLPPPRFTSIKPGNSRPTGMQRRISVGLPTHLRLQGKGYGVPAARKSSFVPSGDPAPR